MEEQTSLSSIDSHLPSLSVADVSEIPPTELEEQQHLLGLIDASLNSNKNFSSSLSDLVNLYFRSSVPAGMSHESCDSHIQILKSNIEPSDTRRDREVEEIKTMQRVCLFIIKTLREEFSLLDFDSQQFMLETIDLIVSEQQTFYHYSDFLEVCELLVDHTAFMLVRPCASSDPDQAPSLSLRRFLVITHTLVIGILDCEPSLISKGLNFVHNKVLPMIRSDELTILKESFPFRFLFHKLGEFGFEKIHMKSAAQLDEVVHLFSQCCILMRAVLCPCNSATFFSQHFLLFLQSNLSQMLLLAEKTGIRDSSDELSNNRKATMFLDVALIDFELAEGNSPELSRYSWPIVQQLMDQVFSHPTACRSPLEEQQTRSTLFLLKYFANALKRAPVPIKQGLLNQGVGLKLLQLSGDSRFLVASTDIYEIQMHLHIDSQQIFDCFMHFAQLLTNSTSLSPIGIESILQLGSRLISEMSDHQNESFFALIKQGLTNILAQQSDQFSTDRELADILQSFLSISSELLQKKPALDIVFDPLILCDILLLKPRDVALLSSCVSFLCNFFSVESPETLDVDRVRQPIAISHLSQILQAFVDLCGTFSRKDRLLLPLQQIQQFLQKAPSKMERLHFLQSRLEAEIGEVVLSMDMKELLESLGESSCASDSEKSFRDSLLIVKKCIERDLQSCHLPLSSLNTLVEVLRSGNSNLLQIAQQLQTDSEDGVICRVALFFWSVLPSLSFSNDRAYLINQLDEILNSEDNHPQELLEQMLEAWKKEFCSGTFSRFSEKGTKKVLSLRALLQLIKNRGTAFKYSNLDSILRALPPYSEIVQWNRAEFAEFAEFILDFDVYRYSWFVLEYLKNCVILDCSLGKIESKLQFNNPGFHPTLGSTLRHTIQYFLDPRFVADKETCLSFVSFLSRFCHQHFIYEVNINCGLQQLLNKLFSLVVGCHNQEFQLENEEVLLRQVHLMEQALGPFSQGQLTFYLETTLSKVLALQTSKKLFQSLLSYHAARPFLSDAMLYHTKSRLQTIDSEQQKIQQMEREEGFSTSASRLQLLLSLGFKLRPILRMLGKLVDKTINVSDVVKYQGEERSLFCALAVYCHFIKRGFSYPEREVLLGSLRRMEMRTSLNPRKLKRVDLKELVSDFELYLFLISSELDFTNDRIYLERRRRRLLSTLSTRSRHD